MLVLTRRKNEVIRIGDDIRIVVIESRGWVRLGVEAPKEMPVHREEIYQKIHDVKSA